MKEYYIFYREVLPTNSARIELLAMGRRFTAAEALESSLVHAAVPANQVMQKARDIVQERLKLGQLPREGCGNIKLDMYRDLMPKVDKIMYVDQLPIPKHKL